MLPKQIALQARAHLPALLGGEDAGRKPIIERCVELMQIESQAGRGRAVDGVEGLDVAESPEAEQRFIEHGVTLMHGEPILYIEPAEVDSHEAEQEGAVDLDHIRPDLAELIARHAITLDDNRPVAVARRRKTNQRTARENIAQLVDQVLR